MSVRARRWAWLLAALVLFGLAAFLMTLGDEPKPAQPPLRAVLPRDMRSPEVQRMHQRRTLPAPAVPPSLPPGQPPRPRDPVLAALPAQPKSGVVVVEANAVRHSPAGQLLIDCLLSRDDGAGLRRFREQTGIDPLRDVDRVAVSEEVVLISGHFADAQWSQLTRGGAREPYGDQGQLYRFAVDGGAGGMNLAAWGTGLLMLGPDEASLKSAIDRVEGRGPDAPAVLSEQQTYGEVYGVLNAEAAAELLQGEQPEVAERLRAAAERIELHVDTSSDVGIVADVRGKNPDDVGDLAKTLGAALAVARVKAQSTGSADLADLLDLARVRPGGPSFRLEAALPLSVLEKHLGQCVERNRRRRADGGRP